MKNPWNWVILMLVIVVVYFMASAMIKEEKICEEFGGVYVRTLTGFTCIKKVP